MVKIIIFTLPFPFIPIACNFYKYLNLLCISYADRNHQANLSCSTGFNIHISSVIWQPLSIFKLHTAFLSLICMCDTDSFYLSNRSNINLLPHVYGYSNRGEIASSASSVIKSCYVIRIQGSLRSLFLFPTKYILSFLNCKMKL